MGTSDPAALAVTVSSRKALPPVKRLRRSPELKLKIVEESLAPGAPVARVARAHGVNANQVFAWRRRYRQGLLRPADGATPGLLAVRVTGRTERGALILPEGSLRKHHHRVVKATVNRRDLETSRRPWGTIQIELPKARLRLTGAVDPESLRVVLEALGG
jgi:transposase-like protein